MSARLYESNCTHDQDCWNERLLLPWKTEFTFGTTKLELLRKLLISRWQYHGPIAEI